MYEIKKLATVCTPDQYNVPGIGCTDKNTLTYVGIAAVIAYLVTKKS